jgi:hypothetical protein
MKAMNREQSPVDAASCKEKPTRWHGHGENRLRQHLTLGIQRSIEDICASSSSAEKKSFQTESSVRSQVAQKGRVQVPPQSKNLPFAQYYTSK